MDKCQYSSTKLIPDTSIFSKKSIKELQHIALIMDGNRRWAKEHGAPMHQGYREGTKRLFEIVQAAIPLGICNITVYAFSTENWRRSPQDLLQLIHIFYISILAYQDLCVKEGVKIEILGDLTPFPRYLRRAIETLVQMTKNQTTISLSVALNYGGRDEIRQAVAKIAQDVENGHYTHEAITEELIDNYMYTKGMRDPDLLIRTSGEQRLSNFLLWQSPYTEIYFTKTLWPNFDVQEFHKAIIAYQGRGRRYGG